MPEIYLYSEISDGMAERFIAQLRAASGPVIVRINSPGGLVNEGLAIANAIRAHREHVTTVNDALAASIASVILCSGRRVLVAEHSLTMVHEPWSLSVGTADDHRKAGETLDKVREALRIAYRRTGKSDAELDAIMAREVWYSAAEAVAEGYADEVVEALALAASLQRFDLSKFRHAPEALRTMPNPNDVLALEKTRRADVRARFGRFATEHRDLLDQCLEDERCTPEIAGNRLLAKLGEGCEPLRPVDFAPSAGAQGDFRAAASDALAIRGGVRLERPHPAARDLMSTSVVDLARMCLSQTGRSVAGLTSRPAIIKAAMTSSDFPLLLGDSIGKILRRGYEEEPASHRRWVRVNPDIPDFKVQTRVGLGSAPSLDAIPELGEYKYGSLSEERETFAITKFGKALAISWEALVNDDLSAFSQLPRMFAQAARRKEADSIYTGLLLANAGAGQTMADTDPLFHANHSNLVASAAFGIDQLSAGRVKMRKQQALGGGYMALEPKLLLVSPEKETAAEQLIASTSRVLATTPENAVPQWVSSLEVLVEPRLPATAVYLIANPAQIDTCELGILADQGGAPHVEDFSDFDTDALHWKTRHVFGARFIDYRGIVKIAVT